MSISAPFIARPVTTTLLTLAIVAAGALGFSKLPVSLMPQVDFPTIVVNAQLPGASPAIVASSVAEPLERHLGQIAAVTEMTSQSAVGATRITLQFDINRDINGASRDVQAAINAARADLPSNMPNNPTYYKYNPTDGPILVLALTSKTMTRGQIYDVASNILVQRLAQLSGIGNVFVGGSTLPAVRVELPPTHFTNTALDLRTSARRSLRPAPTVRKGRSMTAVDVIRFIPMIRPPRRPITLHSSQLIATAPQYICRMSPR
jgi:multidrug efflux pump